MDEESKPGGKECSEKLRWYRVVLKDFFLNPLLY